MAGRSAEIAIPAPIAQELDQYRFHPALIDGAFQTLLRHTVFGDGGDESPYLPTRIRQSAIYGAAREEHDRARARHVGQRRRDRKRHHDRRRGGEPLAVFDGFIVQSLSASSRMSPERMDKGLYEIQWVADADVEQDARENATSPDSSSWLVFVDAAGVGATSPRNCAAAATVSERSNTNPSTR